MLFEQAFQVIYVIQPLIVYWIIHSPIQSLFSYSNLFIHLFKLFCSPIQTHSFIHSNSFIHSFKFIHSLIQTHSFTYSNSFIHLFKLIHSFIQTHAFTNLNSFIHYSKFIHSFILSFTSMANPSTGSGRCCQTRV